MGVLGLIQRICGWLAAGPLCQPWVHKTAEEHQILRFFHSGSFSASSSSSESSANMGTGCVLAGKKKERKRDDLTAFICGKGAHCVLAPFRLRDFIQADAKSKAARDCRGPPECAAPQRDTSPQSWHAGNQSEVSQTEVRLGSGLMSIDVVKSPGLVS